MNHFRVPLMVVMMLSSGFSAGSPLPDASVIKLAGQLKGDHVEITALPPRERHFNIKAPRSLMRSGISKALKPSRSSEREIHFTIPNPATGDYQIELYLCDDANTLCEKHSESFHWDDTAGRLTIQPHKTKGAALTTSSAAGFQANTPQEALAEAKRTHRPLLIDFFGIWCPACNELEEEVFSSPEFKAQSSRFVKLKLDADADLSWELKSRYKIGGYPTVIFATSEGEEINRVVGFRSKKGFLREMENAWSAREKSLAQWRTAAKSGNREALDHLGLIHLDRKEYSGAVEMLATSVLHREQYFEALIGVEEENSKKTKTESKLIAVLENAIREFPNTPESINRRSTLEGLYAEKKETQLQKQQLKDLIQVGQNLIKQPTSQLESHDITRADLWGLLAETYEKLDQPKSAQKAWSQAVLEYRNKIKSGQERGYHLEMAYSLWKSGNFQAAEALYQRFEQLYPEEFTFYFNHASMKLHQKKFTEATRLAQKAWKYSYGDNKLRATSVLAKALQASGEKKQAQELLQEVLHASPLPVDPSIRTHRYVRDLQKLMNELST